MAHPQNGSSPTYVFLASQSFCTPLDPSMAPKQKISGKSSEFAIKTKKTKLKLMLYNAGKDVLCQCSINNRAQEPLQEFQSFYAS